MESPTFLKGRTAKVDFTGGLQGYLGEVHPQVLNNFGLSYPVALCEITLAKILN
jgi:phenylalanyl-tRNA synthetase beta chain